MVETARFKGGEYTGTVRIDPPRAKRPMDALALARWVYDAQKAHLTGLVTGPAGAASQLGAGVWSLGTVITGGGAVAAGRVHADAEAVHDLVLAMKGKDRATVITFGVNGVVPDAMAHPRYRVRPVYRDNGRIDVVRDPVARRSLFCPVRCWPSWEDIDAARTMYLEWHGSMARFAAAAQAVRLATIRCTGLRLPAEPWRESAPR